MGANSEISWTDHTFNPWWGCTRVSPGCVHCYAETFDKRVHGVDKAHWGVKAGRRFFGDPHWDQPLKWNRDAGREGVRRRVFCASMADVFEDRPDLVEPRARLFLMIQATPNLDWLLLTKRPENMVRLARESGWDGDWPPNVWAGCTVEDQQRAEERIPELIQVPARIRFLSCEPLLELVDLGLDCDEYPTEDEDGFVPDGGFLHNKDAGHPCDYACGGEWYEGTRAIHWVIAGGESGHGARPMRYEWAASLRDQCVSAGVAFHYKQWGEHDFNGIRCGKHAAGRLLDGRTWDELPELSTAEVV